jgi:hypothetical protein
MPDVAVQSLGIIFSPPMVRAIIEGKKTQTRRLIKPQPLGHPGAPGHGPTWAKYEAACNEWEFWGPKNEEGRALLYEHGRHKPRYALGSKPWVKESFVYRSKHDRYYFKADHRDAEPYAHNGWKSPRALPKAASRLTIEITDIRAQRLHDITERDAIDEGVDQYSMDDVRRQATWSRRQDFSQLWDIIHKRNEFPWASNPWVWAYTFKLVSVKSYPTVVKE